jgi:hypothetical protein
MEAASGESCTSTRLQRTSSVVVPFSSFHTMTSAWHWGHHCHTQHGDDAFSSLVRQCWQRGCQPGRQHRGETRRTVVQTAAMRGRYVPAAAASATDAGRIGAVIWRCWAR